jgi:hypothetical protein
MDTVSSQIWRNYITRVFHGPLDHLEFLGGLQLAINQLEQQGGIFVGDNLFTYGKNMGFLGDVSFVNAFENNIKGKSQQQYELNQSAIWRMHVLSWAAKMCVNLEGDFVEWACHEGTSAKIICDYLDFNKTGKHYYLYDSFAHESVMDHPAMPEDGSSLHEQVKQLFLNYPNVHVLKGAAPGVLSTGVPEKIAFIHLDISSTADTSALEILFDRIVPGGLLVLNNYGNLPYRAQRQAQDVFFDKLGYRVLELPTGQGLLVKGKKLLTPISEGALHIGDAHNYVNSSFYATANPSEFFKGLQKSISALEPVGIYSGDNLFAIQKTLGFLDDVPFMNAFEKSTGNDDPAIQEVDRSLIWRNHVLAWAAYSCSQLEGDFVECACYKGVSAKVVCDYLDINKTGKHYYLYDLFEHEQGMDHHAMPEHSSSLYEQVKQKFVEHPNVHVIRGSVPEILHTEAPEKIAFMHLDINSAAAEIGALELLFDRIVPGGILVLDDYGWLAYRDQKEAEDVFFAERGYRVLELPTGQGLLVKFPG